MPNYIEKRRRLYYAVLDIPANLRPSFNGKKRFVQSLGTESRSQALSLASPVVARWKLLLDRARRSDDKLSAKAALWRESLSNAADAYERELIEDLIKSEADRYRDYDNDDEPDCKAVRFYQLATGKRTELSELVEPWLTQSGVEEKTKVQHRSALKLLTDKHATAESVDRRTAGKFVSESLSPGRRNATVNRMISSYSGFWDWLIARGYIDGNNPWSSQRLPVAKAGADKSSEEKRPFTEQEAADFLSVLRANAHRRPVDLLVAEILAVTGMRLEEAAALSGSEVTHDAAQGVVWLHVRKSKNGSARRVPVVDAYIVGKLTDRATRLREGSLFPELKPDRFDDRSAALSKRLARQLREHVTKDRSLVACHGWRHRAQTLMEHADVPLTTAEAVVGHKRVGEGAGRYSKGPSDAQLIQAVRAITLPTRKDAASKAA